MSEKQRSTAYCMFVIGSLFFVFGFVTWLNNILIPYMRTSCELTTQVQGYLVTFAFYIAYFVMSIPSSFVLRTWLPDRINVLFLQKKSVL